MLELKHISKTFFPDTVNAKTALDDLSLTLHDGDFVTVIGGNGAGKSTMLNAVAGTLTVDSGSILLDGEDITRKPEHRRAADLGRVFQDPMMGTAGDMWIEENLALAARRGSRRTFKWGISRAEREEYRALLAPLGLGLEDRLTTKVGLLSGGQRQALTLLMASLKKPKLLLLDEHTAALDPKTAAKVLELSDRIVAENGLTTMMVTHNMKDAIAHGNRLIMMDAGRVVVDNIGIYDKVLRGVYAASYSLLCDATAYPVINGAVFYLDDFPSPVPGGDGTYIRRDYSMSIADFYAKVWWPDLMKLAQKYSIRFTGVMIENYEDDTVDAPTRQPDTQQFRYFGSLLLRQGGEVGYHGYNHQPLVLPDTDYKDLYSYRQWPGEDAIVAAMDELIAFQKIVLPHTDGSVYVPPSNILSAAGRQVLGSKVPQIRTIASTYFEDGTDLPYVQEFGVASDGMVEQPRIVSGGMVGDTYMRLAAMNELNMHYVSTHFMHPDDLLDVDRGAEEGWERYKGGFEDYLKWLSAAAPDLRKQTGTECAGAVQRYSQLTVTTESTPTEWTLTLGNFVDEGWLFFRANEGTPGRVTGGELTNLTGNLYLLKANADTIHIEKKGA